MNVIISTKRMIEINILLLTKHCTEAVAAVPVIAVGFPRFWFAASFNSFNILHVNITLQ